MTNKIRIINKSRASSITTFQEILEHKNNEINKYKQALKDIEHYCNKCQKLSILGTANSEIILNIITEVKRNRTGPIGYKCSKCSYFIDRLEVEKANFNLLKICPRCNKYEPFEAVYKQQSGEEK